MKVLLITSKPPYPSIDGGCFASARLLDNLIDEGHNTDLLTIATRKHPFNMEAFPIEVQNKTNINFVDVNTDVTIPGVIGSLFSPNSYNASRFYSKELNERILDSLERNNYDAIILDSLYSTTCIDQIRHATDCKVLIRSHNVEHKIWEERALNTSNIVKKRYFGILSRKLRKYEIATLNKADAVLSISTNDNEIFANSGVSTTIMNLPVSVRATTGSDYNIGTQRAFHLGSMNWKPNIEAVERLMNIWPNVNSDLPMATLHIAGSGMKEWKPKSVINVNIEGFVSDLRNFSSRNGILVSPITSGSGINIKILEMMSFGVPIITTSKGAEGILNTDAITIANTDKELTNAIVHLLSDAIAEKEASQASIEYIKNYHDPENTGKNLTQILNGN